MNENEFDKMLEENKNRFPVKRITRNDTFEFHCKQCGKCCMYRNDIILNPFDVFNIAKAKNITCKEVIDEYCDITQSRNFMNIIVLKPLDNGKCPFLSLDIPTLSMKCSINNNKPTVCKLHPLGTIKEIETNFECDDSKDIIDDNSDFYYIITNQCENSTMPINGTNGVPMVNAKDWIDEYEVNKKEYTRARRLQMDIGRYFDYSEAWLLCKGVGFLPLDNNNEKAKNLKKTLSNYSDLIDKFIARIINIGYTNYDTSLDFCTQAEENIKIIDETCKKFKVIVDNIKNLKIFSENPLEGRFGCVLKLLSILSEDDEFIKPVTSVADMNAKTIYRGFLVNYLNDNRKEIIKELEDDLMKRLGDNGEEIIEAIHDLINNEMEGDIGDESGFYDNEDDC